MQPTKRLSNAEVAANTWFNTWYVPGQTTSADLTSKSNKLAGEIQKATKPTERKALLARSGRVNLEFIKVAFKNSKLIYGVAEYLLQLQGSGVIKPFEWTNAGDFMNIKSVDDLLYCRRMCCYEFVHLCGWLAGSQRIAKGSGAPLYAAAASSIIKGGTRTRRKPASQRPAKNTIVFGEFVAHNNGGGYYHTGIADGRGWIYHLNSGNKKVARQAQTTVFGMLYVNLYMGDYPFK